MSFRYTNELIGRMKQRILFHRFLQGFHNKRFVGSCNGLSVIRDEYARIVDIKIDENLKENFYFNGTTAEDVKSSSKELNVDLLEKSIHVASWESLQLLHRAKEEGYRMSFQKSSVKAQKLSPVLHYRKWFSERGSSLRPLPYEHLKDRNYRRLEEYFRKRHAQNKVKDTESETLIDVIRSSDPHNLPTFLQVPTPEFAIGEQRREMTDNELYFWQRVELIRSAQQNTIRGQKRQYKDIEDNINPPEGWGEKVALRFTE